ncbi:BH0509 family protein [Metabacillus sp. GX 13764]|nr:BH0509 family protein [Metabacillus kandeliae]MCD7036325.1 BH0509 family protein [Metabacillus kandeliae]
MSRQERRNMVQYISSRRSFDVGALSIMTDEEIEHIYTVMYAASLEQNEG